MARSDYLLTEIKRTTTKGETQTTTQMPLDPTTRTTVKDAATSTKTRVNPALTKTQRSYDDVGLLLKFSVPITQRTPVPPDGADTDPC